MSIVNKIMSLAPAIIEMSGMKQETKDILLSQVLPQAKEYLAQNKPEASRAGLRKTIEDLKKKQNLDSKTLKEQSSLLLNNTFIQSTLNGFSPGLANELKKIGDAEIGGQESGISNGAAVASSKQEVSEFSFPRLKKPTSG